MKNLTRLDNIGSLSTRLALTIEAILRRCDKYQTSLSQNALEIKKILINLEKHSHLTDEILTYGEEKLNYINIHNVLNKANAFENDIEIITKFITNFSKIIIEKNNSKERKIASFDKIQNLPSNAILALTIIEEDCQTVSNTSLEAQPSIKDSIKRINHFLNYNNSDEKKYDAIIFSEKNSIKYYDAFFRIIGRTEELWNDDSKKQSAKVRLHNIEAVHKSLKDLQFKIAQLNINDRTSYFLRFKPNGIIYSNLNKSLEYHENFQKEELQKGLKDTPISGHGIFGEMYSSSKKFNKNKSKNAFIQFTARELHSLFTQHRLAIRKALIISVINRLFSVELDFPQLDAMIAQSKRHKK